VNAPAPLAGRAVERAEEILRARIPERVRAGFPLAALTTFRIGGPAALFVEPETEEDLAAVSAAVGETGSPFTVIGKGSNVLISDRGFPGIVIRLGKGFRWTRREDTFLEAGAAMPLPAFAGVASSAGLSGLEFGIAIPGSVGGAVRMNAGAHHRSMSDALARVDVFSVGSGERVSLEAGDLDFRYRGSDLAPDALVVGVQVQLEPRSAVEVRREMDEARAWRRRTQPLAEPNCGSVFKNPPGDHAARLIEAAGGKKLAAGGAHVADKHANFIVTSEGTRAADVVELIGMVQDLVAARFDVHLETEVQLVGDLDPSTS
jgi:UDP-N-acetylmuramate dehydrogenase